MDNNSVIVSQLMELGMTEHEAVIYLVVLEKGEASAGLVLEEVRLHREQVYRALKQLVNRGLLTSFIKHRRGYYAAVNPNILTERAMAKVEVAKSLQPYLEEFHKKKPHLIQIWEGNDAISRHFEDVLQTLSRGGEYLVLLGPGKEFYKLAQKDYQKYGKKYTQQGISSRMLAYEGDDFSGQFTSGQLTRVRYLPSSYASPVGTVIFKDKVVIEIVNPTNPSVITIENRDLALGYRQMFETLWAIAKSKYGK